jgi:hypothetical protein
MNITQGVVNDLLPVYFSGEASNDTRSLVEDYFRENPEFERMARSAGMPLETLRAAQPLAADSEKEKRDLESVRCGLDRRKWLFGLSLFLTLVPISYYFNQGHAPSLTDHAFLWKAAFDWILAASLWFVYFARLRWRTAGLAIAISFTLVPIPFILHFVFGNSPELRGSFAEAVCIWIGAAFMWIGYFRQRSH